MKKAANQCLQKTVFALLFVGYVLFVVAFFIPRWFQFIKPDTKQQYNYGIFMACILDNDGSSRCQYTHFENVVGGTILMMKVLASLGLFAYTVAMATGFLALCWINERRQRLFYVSVGSSVVAAILIIIVVAVHKSYRSYATGSDDAAFYIAAVSIFPLFYGAAMGFLVARTMVFDDGKEDEERIHQERKKRRREKREPIFMFPPTGTMIPEIKRKPIAGIVVSSDDFQRTETEEPFYFKTLNVRNTGKYESTLQEKEVEEISAKTEQYEINPILDESEASMDKHDVHNPSLGLSTSPRPVTPIDVEEEITSLPLEEEHNGNKGKRKKKGPMNFESTDAPLKVGNLMSLALNKSKKKGKMKKKKTKQGRSNSAFDTEEHEPGKVDVHGQTKTHSHTFEQLPEVDK